MFRVERKGNYDKEELFVRTCSMEIFQTTTRANTWNNLDVNLDIALIDPEMSAIEILNGGPRATGFDRNRSTFTRGSRRAFIVHR